MDGVSIFLYCSILHTTVIDRYRKDSCPFSTISQGSLCPPRLLGSPLRKYLQSPRCARHIWATHSLISADSGKLCMKSARCIKRKGACPGVLRAPRRLPSPSLVSFLRGAIAYQVNLSRGKRTPIMSRSCSECQAWYTLTRSPTDLLGAQHLVSCCGSQHLSPNCPRSLVEISAFASFPG